MVESSYRLLLSQPYFARMAAASLLARLGGAMWGVTLVLFVLQKFHSPSLAGLTVLLSLAPGLVLAPLAGAALDRWGRVRMIMLDYVIAVVTIALLLVLTWTRQLSVTWLLGLMVVSSLSVPLGMSGARSLFPMLAPRHMWERANALDAVIYALSNITGPALAGLVVGIWGTEAALAVVGLVWFGGVIAVAGVRVVEVGLVSGSVFTDAWHGLREVFSNPVVRAITLSVPLQNMGRGIYLIALPVFVLQDLHRGPQSLGWLLAVNAGFSLVSGALCGRLRTAGRERGLMVVALLLVGVAVASIALAPNLWVAFVCMALVGLPSGLFDIPMFSMRQRAVQPGILGRVLAVSMSFNFLGQPIGSGLGGRIAGVSPRLGFVVGGALMMAAAGVLALLMRDSPWFGQPAEPGLARKAENLKHALSDRSVRAMAHVTFEAWAASQGVDLDVKRFPEGTRTAEDAARAIGCSIGQIVKSLIFVAGSRPVVALVSGENRVDPAKLSALAGAAVGKADPETVRAATGYAIGGVPPFGHRQLLPVFMDPDLLRYATVWAAAGRPDSVFAIEPALLLELSGAEVGDLKAG